jgi:hypothetical protein
MVDDNPILAGSAVGHLGFIGKPDTRLGEAGATGARKKLDTEFYLQPGEPPTVTIDLEIPNRRAAGDTACCFNVG